VGKYLDFQKQINYLTKKTLMKTKKLAIDVALCPPDDVIEKLISINQKAGKDVWGPLGKTDYIPHISLAMGCVELDKLTVVQEIVKKVAEEFSSITVELDKLYFTEMPDGVRDYAMSAKNPLPLQELHESMMNALRDCMSYDCTKEMIFREPGQEVTEPNYINKFLSSHSFENFDPHITTRAKVGVGEEDLPIDFTASRIAICHVGTMTTCRKILFEIKVKSSLRK